MVLVGVLLMAGVLYALSPVLGCWYNEYRFNRYVHVQIEVPSCGVTLSAPRSGSCRYIFSFEGEKEPKAIQFQGTGLHYTYDPAKRTYIVSGVGRVVSRGNAVELAESQVLFNGQSLPRATQPVLGFVRKDGHLVSGYCELNWL
jgi:hypothetical protein